MTAHPSNSSAVVYVPTAATRSLDSSRSSPGRGICVPASRRPCVPRVRIATVCTWAHTLLLPPAATPAVAPVDTPPPPPPPSPAVVLAAGVCEAACSYVVPVSLWRCAPK